MLLVVLVDLVVVQEDKEQLTWVQEIPHHIHHLRVMMADKVLIQLLVVAVVVQEVLVVMQIQTHMVVMAVLEFSYHQM